jgi:hypothetical protein
MPRFFCSDRTDIAATLRSGLFMPNRLVSGKTASFCVAGTSLSICAIQSNLLSAVQFAPSVQSV